MIGGDRDGRGARDISRRYNLWDDHTDCNVIHILATLVREYPDPHGSTKRRVQHDRHSDKRHTGEKIGEKTGKKTAEENGEKVGEKNCEDDDFEDGGELQNGWIQFCYLSQTLHQGEIWMRESKIECKINGNVIDEIDRRV